MMMIEVRARYVLFLGSGFCGRCSGGWVDGVCRVPLVVLYLVWLVGVCLRVTWSGGLYVWL